MRRVGRILAQESVESVRRRTRVSAAVRPSLVGDSGTTTRWFRRVPALCRIASFQRDVSERAKLRSCCRLQLHHTLTPRISATIDPCARRARVWSGRVTFVRSEDPSVRRRRAMSLAKPTFDCRRSDCLRAFTTTSFALGLDVDLNRSSVMSCGRGRQRVRMWPDGDLFATPCTRHQEQNTICH